MQVFDESMRKNGAGTDQVPAAADQSQANTGQAAGANSSTGNGQDQAATGNTAGGNGDGQSQAATGGAGNGKDKTATGSGGGNGKGKTANNAGAGGTGSSQTAAGVDPRAAYGGGASTSAERRAELDRKLNRQLATFDGMILDRRADVTAEENKEGGGSSKNAGAAGGGGYGGEEAGDGAPPLLTTAKAEDTTGNVVTTGHQPDLPADNRKGDYKQANAKPHDDRIPPDIPSGDDDDIVARQLREAAMNEADPELRAKLWDEYRKYKKGVQAKR